MSGDFKISLEMGITHAHFLRTLEFFLDGKAHTVTGTEIDIPGNGQRVGISLSEQRERAVGPTVRFPVTDVEIIFSGYSEAERKGFMDRFEMIFRRGGG